VGDGVQDRWLAVKYPTPAELQATFRDLTYDDATLIVALCDVANDPGALEELIDERCPATAAYVQRMHNSPYRSRDWRREVILHAIDRALGTHGVKPLGLVDLELGPPYSYCNAGDTYNVTLIYNRDADELTIGCWGDTLEAYERKAVPEAWDQYGRDAFTSELSSLLVWADPDHDHDATDLDSEAIDKLWRDGCRDLNVDEWIEGSDGYTFRVEAWARAARRGGSHEFSVRLVRLAKECRVEDPPPCLVAMGCRCSCHAVGMAAAEPCDPSEARARQIAAELVVDDDDDDDDDVDDDDDDDE
jgi:hypothetical protein